MNKPILQKINPREIGAYTATEAAHYLHLPISTLRAWAFGQKYISANGTQRRFQAVLDLPENNKPLLSFSNLVEIHVLEAMCRRHSVALKKVRRGLQYVSKELGIARPLLHQQFLTDGFELFVEKSDLLLSASQEGQMVIRLTLEKFLQRVDRDPKGVPIRLFPFTRQAGMEEVKSIVIDPEIAFGRPVLFGTGVPTSNVFDRFYAGEPTADLAKDFRVDAALIEEAIRCEQIKQRAG